MRVMKLIQLNGDLQVAVIRYHSGQERVLINGHDRGSLTLAPEQAAELFGALQELDTGGLLE
jgi:hypothetical protein